MEETRTFLRIVESRPLRLTVLALVVIFVSGVPPKLFAAPRAMPDQEQEPGAQTQSQTEHEAGVPTPLAALVDEAKKNDPAILTAEPAAKAATFVAPQMSTRPDLQFTLQQFSVGSPRPFAGYTNSDFAYIGLGVSQQLPYPGKLKLRGTVADRDADTAKAHIEVVLAELPSERNRRWCDSY